MARLIATVTQGSNDAFAEAEVQTGLSGQTDRAYRIRRIIWEFPAVVGASGYNIQGSLTRQSQASLPNIQEASLLDAVSRYLALSTAVGFTIYENIVEHLFAEELNVLVVEDPIYIQIDSNASSTTNTLRAVIEYETVQISISDRLALLQQLLSNA